MNKTVDIDIFSANPPNLTEALKQCSVFIAGAGGLGSNCAMMLARAGVVNFTIVDFDVIEPSNLNRQFYFRDQLGLPKVEALKDNLLRINPEICVKRIQKRITESNCEEIIPGDCDIILECFDSAESKATLVSFVLKYRSTIPLIAVSGLAGSGPVETIKYKKGPGKMWLIGDGECEATPENGTLSTRVMTAAAMQAHKAVQILIESLLSAET